MSDTQLEIASSCTSLFVDGTFSICPHPFFQVLFVTGKVGINKFPIATALLPNKLEATYKETFFLIKDICAKNNNDLDVLYVHSDCEQGLINAIKAAFPDAQIRLCRFHIVDAIRRHANSNGLRPIINRRSDFKKFYARVRQIFFFPMHLWPEVWKLMLGELGEETKSIPAVQDFIQYLVRAIAF